MNSPAYGNARITCSVVERGGYGVEPGSCPRLRVAQQPAGADGGLKQGGLEPCGSAIVPVRALQVSYSGQHTSGFQIFPLAVSMVKEVSYPRRRSPQRRVSAEAICWPRDRHKG